MSDAVVELVPDEDDEGVVLVGTPVQVLDGALNLAIRRSVQSCVTWAEVVLFGDDPASALAALRIAYMHFVEVLATERPKGCPPSIWKVVEEARGFFDALPVVEEGEGEPEWAGPQVLGLMSLCERWREELHLATIRRLRRLSKKPGAVGRKARRDLEFYRFGSKVMRYAGELRHKERRDRLREMKAVADLAAIAMSSELPS